MTTDTQLSTVVEEKGLTRITNYMESAIVKARFAQIMGERGASTYISSVLIAVANSKALQECAPVSIYTSALRAATLRLSVDPGTGQAYLVPFNGQATLIVGYKGLHDMAIRTNRYRYINVSKIYEGQEIIEDQISGFLKISGLRTSDEYVGWIAAFEMLPRFGSYAKVIYMTNEQIHEHAQKYSSGYGKPNKDGTLVDRWGKPTIWHTEREKMESKTILRALIRRWGYIDPADVRELEAVDNMDDAVDALNVLAETAETRPAPAVPTNRDATVSALMGTGNPDPIKDATWAEFQKLRARAVEVAIAVPNITRGDHTESDLRQYVNAELLPIVADAEAQAVAGEMPQE